MSRAQAMPQCCGSCGTTTLPQLRRYPNRLLKHDALGCVRPLPLLGIGFWQIGDAEAFKHVPDLAAVLGVVQDDVEDRGAATHPLAIVIGELLVQTPFVTQPAREGGEDRVGALVAVDDIDQ